MPHSEATVSQLKIEAMRQRIHEGADWRDTRLFRDYYAQQLRDKGRAKGATTLDALAAVYQTDYDGLIRSIRDTGFDWSPEAEIYVHVLDDGAFCWTSGAITGLVWRWRPGWLRYRCASGSGPVRGRHIASHC